MEKIIGKGFLLAAAMLAASVACADTYQVTGNVTDLDLTDGTYEADRLIGPGQDKDYTLSGTLTHAPATVASPFCFIGNNGNTASKAGKLSISVVTNDIGATTPLSFSNYGLFRFDNTYFINADWTDDYLRSDGNATAYFKDLRIASNDVALDGDNPSGLCKLLSGPNPNSDNSGAQIKQLYIGYGYAGSASLTLKNTSLKTGNYVNLGDSAPAAVQGSLTLDHAIFETYAQDWGFQVGYNCPDEQSHVASTNKIILGAGSRLLVGRIMQKKAPSLLFTFAGGSYESKWNSTQTSNSDHALFYSHTGHRGRVVVTNAPNCNFDFKISNIKAIRNLMNSAQVSVVGDGDIVKSGPGTLRVNYPVNTIGTVRIEEGAIAVAADNALPSAFEISSGAALDIQGVCQVVHAPWGAGHITSTSTNPGTLALVCSENTTLEKVSSSVNLEKRGSGTLTAKGTFGEEIAVSEGKLVLTPFPNVPKGPTRYWRFKVDGIRANADNMSLGEITLYSSGANVTPYASVTNDTEHTTTQYSSQYQNVNTAYDGNVDGSKWRDWRIGQKETDPDVRNSVWLKFDFGEKGMLVSGYKWYTSNDGSVSDPVSWRLQRSDDGETWEDVDVQTDYAVTTDRKALAYSYEDETLAGQISPLKKITVAQGATLEINGIDVVAESISAPAGAITFANGGTLTQVISVGSGETRTVRFKDGDLPAGAGLAKAGGGTATVTGLSGMTGAVAVGGGELQIAAAPALADAKYFRFTVKKTRGNNTFQLSELSLYDSNTNRVNAGLVATNLAELVAGSAAFDVSHRSNGKYSHGDKEGLDKLFDGDTGSKLCVTDPKPGSGDDPEDQSKWCFIVMRLADDAAPVASYSFTTANDATPSRSPETWTMEASVDGITWELVNTHTNDTETPGNTYTESTRWELQLGSSGGSAAPAFAAGSTVSVASGARLVLDDDGASMIYGLSINVAAGAGTIENFRAAPSGVVYLENVANPSSLARSGVDLITFENCPVRPSFAGWTVYVNGQPTSYRVKATDTGLQLSLLGLTIILR